MPLPHEGSKEHSHPQRGRKQVSPDFKKVSKAKVCSQGGLSAKMKETCHCCLTGGVGGRDPNLNATALDGPRIFNVAFPDWCGIEKATQQQS